MIDHMSLRVRDLAAAKAFYTQALAPLGYEIVMEFPEAIGMGVKGKPDLWITTGGREGATTHVAFRTGDHAKVDAFHAAGLAAGGSDMGPPGIREMYHPSYYGAFLGDPDGNNIEAVCHGPGFGMEEAKPARAKRAAKAKPKAKPKAKAKAKAKSKAKPSRKKKGRRA